MMRVFCEANGWKCSVDYMVGDVVRGESNLGVVTGAEIDLGKIEVDFVDSCFSIRDDEGKIYHLNGWMWDTTVILPNHCQHCGKDWYCDHPVCDNDRSHQSICYECWRAKEDGQKV